MTVAPVKCEKSGLNILETVSSYWGGVDIFTLFHTFQGVGAAWQKATPRRFFKTAIRLVGPWVAADKHVGLSFLCVVGARKAYSNMAKSHAEPFQLAFADSVAVQAAELSRCHGVATQCLYCRVYWDLHFYLPLSKMLLGSVQFDILAARASGSTEVPSSLHFFRRFYS